MQILIEIPDSDIPKKQEIITVPIHFIDGIVCEAGGFGFDVLPKGHGRLIDADKTLTDAWQNFFKHEDEWEEKDEDYLPLHRFYDQNGFECCQQTIVNALTIIEAESDKE